LKQELCNPKAQKRNSMSTPRLLTQLTLIFFFVGLLYGGIFLFHQLYAACLLTLAALVMLSSSFLWNRLGSPKIAKIHFIAFANLIVFILSERVNPNDGFPLGFFAVIGLPFILLDDSEPKFRWSMVGFTFSIAGLAMLTNILQFQPLTEQNHTFFETLNFLTFYLVIATQVFYFIQNARAVEKDLQKSIRKLNDAQSLAHIGNWEWNALTGETIWSNELFKIYECDPAAFRPSYENFLQFIHPDDVEKTLQTLSEGRARKIAFSFSHRVLVNQKTKYLTHLGTWETLDGVEIVRGTTQEVTETITLQNELRKNEVQFRQILDAIPDFVIVKGPRSKLVWGNKSFRDYYGMSNEELQGIIDAPFNEPDYTQQYIRDDQQVFETQKTLEIREEPVVRKDGVVRYFHTVKSPIFDEDQHATHLVAVSRDITDSKETASLLEQQRAKMIASSKMSALGEMTGNIAHEINNPLAIIHSRAGQLRELAASGETDSQFVATTAENIESTVMRISKIVKSLRTFSRNAEKDPYEKVSLKNLIQDTVELCIQRYRASKIDLKINEFSADLTVECQSVQISQVLLNLLNNACDAVQPLNEKWVEVTVESNPEDLIIRVTDSGSGIPDSVRTKIMTPFFTTKEVGKGIGLGLSISRGIIEAHHGSLTLDPESAHTRFVIRLPHVQTDTQKKNSA
jgi:PAS domain S-box-containing protein